MRPHATHQSRCHFHTANTFPCAGEMEGNKVFSNISKKIKQLANVVPKVDALGPEIEYIPKKIEVNKPMPDLKLITCKIDNEGLEIVHLPKEVKVHKGTPKFDNLQARVDNKGIEILHGQTPAKVLQKFAISEPEPETLPEEPEQLEEERKTEILPGPISCDEVFTLPQTVSSPYVVPEVSQIQLASRVSTPSSSSSTDASLPPTPRAEISKATLRQLFSSQGSSHHLSPAPSARVSPQDTRVSLASARVSPRSRVPTPPPRSPSPKPKLPTPPESPELILRPILKPPRKVKTPTPPPSKLIQVSPVKYQGLFVQTDSVDKFDGSNQTDFAEPKKNSGLKWWKWLLLILILLLIFIGVGVAIGYAVGFFGKSKLRCSDGFEKVDNLCQPLTSSSTPEPCDGCNCPLDILLDPGLSGSGGDTAEVTSPRSENV